MKRKRTSFYGFLLLFAFLAEVLLDAMPNRPAAARVLFAMIGATIATWIVIAGIRSLANHPQRVARFRLRHGLCPKCGYDLRASGERCPECGVEIPAGMDVPHSGQRSVEARRS